MTLAELFTVSERFVDPLGPWLEFLRDSIGCTLGETLSNDDSVFKIPSFPLSLPTPLISPYILSALKVPATVSAIPPPITTLRLRTTN